MERKKQPAYSRRKPFKLEKQKILILCEGKNTEPSYFKQFRLQNVSIKVIGEGKNTVDLVQDAIEFKKQDKYDQVWCVFDYDEHGNVRFNESLTLAMKNKIRTAYSIQAFEYWLILHFEDHQGGKLHRKEYHKKLTAYLKPNNVVFDKDKKIVEPAFFELLESIDEKTGRPRKLEAIERAKRIYSRLDHKDPGSEESSTTVFTLIEEFIKFE